MDITCSKCHQDQDDSAFYVRKNGTLNPWCKACYKSWYVERSGGMVLAKCSWCGVGMEVTARRAAEPRIFCSRSCKGKARYAIRAAEILAAKPLVRICIHCGVDMPQAMRADSKFCSETCSNRAHAITRKMHRRIGLAGRKKGAPLLERNYIAERDKFRCGLCGGRVDMKLQHPDPLFGSIDHIVPLSRGGTNDLANLQLAHLRCNLSKNDRGGDEQLRLIG
jgi:5-methylcytosine-specific restriction endonuclease McrA